MNGPHFESLGLWDISICAVILLQCYCTPSNDETACDNQLLCSLDVGILLSYNPLLGLGTSGNLKSHLCWSVMLLQLITLWQLWSFILTSVLFPPAAVGVPAVPMHNVPLPFCRCVNVGRNHLICGNGFQTTGTLNCASNAFFGSYFIFCSQQDILQ